MKKPPRRVRVGPFNYSVQSSVAAIQEARAAEGSDDLIGWHDEQSLRVVVHPDQPHDGVAEVLLHELLHAIFARIAGKDYGAKAQEELVATLSPALLDLLRRNPQLVRFLLEEG